MLASNRRLVRFFLTPRRPATQLCQHVRTEDFIAHQVLEAQLPFAKKEMPPGAKPQLQNQRRLLHGAIDLFGRQTIADGLKISSATLDGWMNGNSDMPESMLSALATLLVELAGKHQKK